MPVDLQDREAELLKILSNSTGFDEVKFYGSIQRLSLSEEGLSLIYENIDAILKHRLFEQTVYNEPQQLNPQLVKGTLLAGYPYQLLELLSELRFLAIANRRVSSGKISAEEAKEFIQQVLISNFDLLFDIQSEETRSKLSKSDRKRCKTLFTFLFNNTSLVNLESRLAEELSTLTAQRRLNTQALRSIIGGVRQNLELSRINEAHDKLNTFINAVYHPTALCRKYEDTNAYLNAFVQLNQREKEKEAEEVGHMLEETGLVSDHLYALAVYSVQQDAEVFWRVLHLNAHGRVEYQVHKALVSQLVQHYCLPERLQSLYGLRMVLQKNFLSRKPVRNGIKTILNLSLHSDIKKLFSNCFSAIPADKHLHLLVGGVLQVLGQPLGIGQGNNPTCQSARGLSMWAQHSPGKLLDMITNVAASNHLAFRYEGELIESTSLTEQKSLDTSLDPVSTIMVPHLDFIYQEMMKRAMIKHFREDPHISVNPAFYGHWIQTGFASCYNPVTNAIQNYNEFTRIYYASFHPEHNGDNRLVYPVPLGIFITSSQGEFLGFHAISLLRVKCAPDGEWRAYFYNPNNEGRQNWGQNITPTVANNGEKHGESSLPFHQLAARVYAFHYNSIGIQDKVEQVPQHEVDKVRDLSTSSWGKKYVWL